MGFARKEVTCGTGLIYIHTKRGRLRLFPLDGIIDGLENSVIGGTCNGLGEQTYVTNDKSNAVAVGRSCGL